MHKLSWTIIKYVLSLKIDTITIGHNELWKQPVNIGKGKNQNFGQTPFNMLVDQIKYEGNEAGIGGLIQEDSYARKCLFLDKEDIDHHEAYTGKRIKQGIFISEDETLKHAVCIHLAT